MRNDGLASIGWRRILALTCIVVLGIGTIVGSGGGGGGASTTQAPLSIATQPANVTVVEGQVAAFTVTAASTGPLTYQWRRDSVDIAGATGSTYTTAATVVSDNGAQFSVVVSNGAATATSNAAMLTVVASTPTTTWVVSTLAATTSFLGPKGVASDSVGTVYVADSSNEVIRKITSTEVVSIVAGSDGLVGGADGIGAAASFFGPAGVATDVGGNVYVADLFNHTIRKITGGAVVSTLAGLAGSSGSADGTGSAARFSSPSGVATDSAGNVYVADTLNHTIRAIAPSGAVRTLAGLAGFPSSIDGTGSGARFVSPTGLAIDSAGNIYVADSGNNKIRKITATGVVTTIAGLSTGPGSADGIGTAARFLFPRGVATDIANNIYVADTNNHTIRKITPSGVVSTVAGLAGVSGNSDGTGAAARFNLPTSVATDSVGNIYVSDFGNNRIRKLTPQ